MLGNLLAWLFPVKLPGKLMAEDVEASRDFIRRADPFLGRNANIQDRAPDAVTPARRMAMIVYAPSLREIEAHRERTLREAYTVNILAVEHA